MQTYTGGCHCGRVRFSVTGEFTNALECNCSHCEKKGLLLAFVPGDALTLTAGDDASQTEYRFHTKKLKHLFCPVCGVQSYSRGENADGAETIAINLRCIDGIELASLPRIPYDGKNI